MQYLLPLCDNDSTVGFVALASDVYLPLSEPQRAALRMAAQFTGYEFRRFNASR